MGRRPDRHETEVLSEENLKEIRYNMAHLSLPAVRDAYERALFQTKALDGLMWAAILAIVKTALLLYYSGQFGFMSDELYFLACAKRPGWGYADLPPLLPWLTWVEMHTLGSSLGAIRVYPAIAAGATVILAG